MDIIIIIYIKISVTYSTWADALEKCDSGRNNRLLPFLCKQTVSGNADKKNAVIYKGKQ